MGNYWTTRDLTRSSNSSRAEDTIPLREDEPNNRSRRRRRKRTVEEQRDEDVEEVSPKRRHIQTTSSYIYETLYKQGTGSDITIIALDKKWELHKIYLCQSGYFSSMFSGRWEESDKSVISVDIPDPNVTEEALDLAFGSLYRDSITLGQEQILPTVAISTMFQLDGLLQVCQDYMRETLCAGSVVDYLKAASLYGLQDIEKECRFWLSVHLLTSYSIPLLKEISLEMMEEIVPSPDLFVMQVEMDLYSLVKKWIFLKLHTDWIGNLSKLTSSAEGHFKALFEKSGVPFLETQEGVPYRAVFQSLRLQNILTDGASVGIVEGDGIIPQSWLLPKYREHWLKMVMVEQRLDTGSHLHTDEDFNRNAVRCGRVLTTPNEYCWRWTGFSFGVDILLIYSNGLISVKRNTHSQPCLASVSLQTARQIALRLRVVSFSESSEVSTSQDTGVLRLMLGQDETHHVMTLDKDAHFPLYISFNFSLTSMNENI